MRDSQRWHASPSYPAKHLHRPSTVSHRPMLEHSARACADVAPVGTSTHARSDGHVRAEQSGALYSAMSVGDPNPLKQMHLEFTVSHTPRLEQLFSAAHEPPTAPGGRHDAASSTHTSSRCRDAVRPRTPAIAAAPGTRSHTRSGPSWSFI